MSNAKDVAETAENLFKGEIANAVNEVISGLFDCFDDCRFYEANGYIYMEDDDGRFPAVKVFKIPKV